MNYEWEDDFLVPLEILEQAELMEELLYEEENEET